MALARDKLLLRSALRVVYLGVADPHHVNADPDPAPACHLTRIRPSFHFESDPDPSLQIKVRNLASAQWLNFP